MPYKIVLHIPEPRLEPPEELCAIKCSRCGRVINDTEMYGEYMEESVCSDCAEIEFLHLTSRERVAIMLAGMGYDVMEE